MADLLTRIGERVRNVNYWGAGVIPVLVAVSLTGCLNRTGTGVSLPYVKPANSVEQTDPVKVQIAARMQEMETELQRLWDTIERLRASGGDEQEITALRDRITFIERQLGIDPVSRGAVQRQQPQLPLQPAGNAGARRVAPGTNPNPPVSQPGVRQPPEQQPVEIANPPLQTDEQEYRTAYSTFRKGDLDTAVHLFETFLNAHPKSDLASSAVYWVGEAHYAKGRFEEAVLQFDRVLKEYPGSKKELSALLKQGQAFDKMGDPRSARIIFEKLVKEHPHTAQARIAARKLKALPKDRPEGQT